MAGIFEVRVQKSHHSFPVVHAGNASLAASRVVEMYLRASLSAFPQVIHWKTDYY